MRKFLVFPFLLFLNGGLLFSQGTFLGRIAEFDAENAVGLMDTGNYLITYEHISYIMDKDEAMEVTYHYRIKKLAQNGNDTFGLSLRNRGHYQAPISDVRVDDTLSITADGKNTEVVRMASARTLFNDDGTPIKVNLENNEEYQEYYGMIVSNGYLGWYFFTLDFHASSEVDVVIQYQTSYYLGMRYNSRPFWIPVSDTADLTLTIENNCNTLFLGGITDCLPRDTLVTENWRLEKPDQNRVNITYVPGWFSENKEISISFPSIYQPSGSPSEHFLEVVWDGLFVGGDGSESGVFIHDHSGQTIVL